MAASTSSIRVIRAGYTLLGLKTFFTAFQWFLVGIGISTLITGGIGVSNIMNVVLEERTKEIGIKMALGARKSFVLWQFVTETLLITGLGLGLRFDGAGNYALVATSAFVNEPSR